MKMKLWIICFVLLTILITYTACEFVDEDSVIKVADILNGEHSLRKMLPPEKKQMGSTSLSGGFFLIVGGVKGESKSTSITTVTFAWKMNDNSYAISTLPLEKIRVRFNEEKIIPTITFEFKGKLAIDVLLQEIMDKYVKYAVITCREKDWPININIPLN